jgi:hypothetical protein
MKKRDNTPPSLNRSQRFMMSQLPGKQQIDIQPLQQRTAAASTYPNAADLYLFNAFPLWNRDGKAFWVSHSTSYSFDQGEEGLRFGEVDDAAHANAFMAWDWLGDGVDRMTGMTDGVQFQIWVGEEASLRGVVL